METVEIGIVCTVLGACISYATFQMKKEKEIKTENLGAGKIINKLDNISKNMDEIRLDFKEQSRDVNRIKEMLIRTDESVKSAHKRIDKIEDMENKEKGEM